MTRMRRLVPLALVLGLSALPLGCADDNAPYEPLGSNAGAVLAGHVLGQDGAPLSGAVVTAEPWIDGMAASVQAAIASDGVTASAASIRRATATDATGRFAFTGLEPGTWLLTGESRDHLAGTARVTLPGPTFSPAAETTFVNVDLTPTGTFFGNALLENATNHQSTVVYVDGTSYVAVTDAAGDYTIAGVPIGTRTVKATHPGYLDDAETGSLASAGDSTTVAGMFLPLDSNIAPAVTIAASPDAYTFAEATFDASASDKDGSVVLYEWDFEDDGVWDVSSPSSPAVGHTWTVPGTYVVKLRVTDDDGAIGLDAVTVTVYDTPDAVFVDNASGAPGNPGTPDQPLDTISGGIARAQLIGKDLVVITDAVYNEAVALQNGISVAGGYAAGSWTAPPSGTGTVTRITSGTASATAVGIVDTTLVTHVHFQNTGAAALANAIGLSASNCTSVLRFTDCVFEAGNGAAGAVGANGANGATGGSGNPGSVGICSGTSPGSGGTGGVGFPCGGGAGGNGGSPTQNGFGGSIGGCAGGSGGSGGATADPGLPGQNGGIGGNGTTGTSGAAASNVGQVVGGQWTPAASGDGGDGNPGKGGGGGGGGGGQTTIFHTGEGSGNGGGGGGGGGGGATRGFGGRGGWASFAVWLYNASPVFDGCTFTVHFGGPGGQGGNGGVGGTGGTGGAGAAFCTSDVGRGGTGGNGGKGGDGGGGAGGPGGPSVNVARAGSSAPTLLSPNYVIAVAGTGAPGGFAGGGGTQAPFGPNGVHATTYLFP